MTDQEFDAVLYYAMAYIAAFHFAVLYTKTVLYTRTSPKVREAGWSHDTPAISRTFEPKRWRGVVGGWVVGR